MMNLRSVGALLAISSALSCATATSDGTVPWAVTDHCGGPTAVAVPGWRRKGARRRVVRPFKQVLPVVPVKAAPARAAVAPPVREAGAAAAVPGAAAVAPWVPRDRTRVAGLELVPVRLAGAQLARRAAPAVRARRRVSARKT